MTAATVWLSCGVVRSELEALRRQGRIAGELVFVDSMLHMDPPRLEAALGAALREGGARSGVLVLVYGDCCARMLDLVRDFRVGRVAVINCAQLLLGRDRYRQLMHEEAFLVLPEWARRWREVMQVELGLSPDVARQLLGEHRKSLVYLDTGLEPVPSAEMAAFAAYSGLPWRSETVTLDIMLDLLLTAQAQAALPPPTDGASRS